MKYIILLVLGLLSLVAFAQPRAAKPLRHFMQSAASPASEVQYGNNAEAGRYVTSHDAKIYFEVYGKGTPIVILHGGIVGSSFEMHQLIDSLSTRFQVIAISTRGHGRSEMGSRIPSYTVKSDDVLAVINSVTGDSVSVVGFSDGAYTGYFLAALHPEKVRSLIAIGAGQWTKGFRTFANNRGLFFNMDSLYFKQQLAIMPEPARFDEWLKTLNNYYTTVSVGKETLSRIRCPVLIMAGELDQNAPLETVIAAYKLIPHAQLSIIPNAPHPVFLVNFPAVWSSMTPFLDVN